ncbi:hypothetical protein [Streptomyces sp. NPDC017673]
MLDVLGRAFEPELRFGGDAAAVNAGCREQDLRDLIPRLERALAS